MRVRESILNDGKGALSASYLVIHETANPGATALNHVSYWKSDGTYSVHYVMDWDGVAYHCVPDDRLCWHVGNGNGYCVGIELCHALTPVQFRQVWDAAVDFAAWYLGKRGWGIDRLISHDEAARRWGGSDHTDPIGYFRQFGRTWEQFKGAVKAKLAGAKPKQVPGTRKNQLGLHYRMHVRNLGWLDSVADGQTAGTVGFDLRAEALKITPPAGVELEVDVHVQNRGWVTYRGVKRGVSSGTGSSANDPIMGTVGKALQLEAVRIRVTKLPDSLKGKKLRVQAHVANKGWLPAVGAGQVAGTTGQNRQLEALRIWFE